MKITLPIQREGQYQEYLPNLQRNVTPLWEVQVVVTHDSSVNVSLTFPSAFPVGLVHPVFVGKNEKEGGFGDPLGTEFTWTLFFPIVSALDLTDTLDYIMQKVEKSLPIEPNRKWTVRARHDDLGYDILYDKPSPVPFTKEKWKKLWKASRYYLDADSPHQTLAIEDGLDIRWSISYPKSKHYRRPVSFMASMRVLVPADILLVLVGGEYGESVNSLRWAQGDVFLRTYHPYRGQGFRIVRGER